MKCLGAFILVSMLCQSVDTSTKAFVCLFVCLLTTSHTNYWSELRENFTRDLYLDKEVVYIKLWKSSMSGNFVEWFLPLWDGSNSKTNCADNLRSCWRIVMNFLRGWNVLQATDCSVLVLILITNWDPGIFTTPEYFKNFVGSVALMEVLHCLNAVIVCVFML